MTNLKQLVQNIKTVQARANMDLEAVPYQTRASLTNLKRDSEAKLEGLRNEYVKTVRANSLGLFLVGDAERAEKFAAVSADEAGTFTVKADDLYQRLATRVEGSLGASREFSVTQLQILIQGIRDMEKQLGIVKMPMPQLKRQVVCPDRAYLVNYIRTLLQDVVGDDLIRLYVDRKINEQAIAAEFAGTTLPVTILNATPEEIVSLSPLFTNANSVTVGTTEDGEVNPEFVLKQLSFIKKKLKKSNN